MAHVYSMVLQQYIRGLYKDITQYRVSIMIISSYIYDHSYSLFVSIPIIIQEWTASSFRKWESQR